MASMASATLATLIVASAATVWITLGAAEAPAERARPGGPQESPALEAHRAQIQRLTADGGVMITSNAAYASEDRGQTHYGQHYEAVPGGLDARGCLWGERDGEILGVYWNYFMGWDPAAEQGFFYQSSTRGGRAGFGHGGPLGEDGHWLEQRFNGPGTAPFSRHESQWFATDSVMTRSFSAEIEGEWTLQRTYTWIRQPGRTPPC